MADLGTWRQYIATISSTFSFMMTAVSFVWFTPLMVEGRMEVPATSDDLGWLVAFIEVGEGFGPIPCGYIADKWGRKPSLLLCFPIILTSWVITLFTRSLLGLYIARAWQGFATGIVFTICPAYIAEIAHPSIRGKLSGQMQTMWFIGILYSYCTGPYLRYDNYIYASAIPAFLFIGTFVFMPETPYFLTMKGKKLQARKSLEWLRGTINVSEEIMSIEQSIASETQDGSSGWTDLFTSKKCRKPLLIMSFITVIKYLAGTSTIPNFATETLSKGGLEDYADMTSIALGVVLLVSVFISAFIADSIGRKPLIIASTAGVGLASTIITTYFCVAGAWSVPQNVTNKSEGDVLVEYVIPENNYGWILPAGFALFCITTNIGLVPIALTLQAEYFPSHVRASAGAYCTLICNATLFVSLKLYQMMEDHIGLYSNYCFFAAVAFLSLFVLCPYIEETAKKSLGEIQQSEMRTDKPVHKIHQNDKSLV